MNKKSNKLLIFTKSPVLGEVKTRLQPDYSQEQSLLLHTILMKKTLALTEKLDAFDIELCCAPDRNTLFFLECENDFPIQLSNQEGADLGERMAYSLSIALQSCEKVVIIGTDCPDMDKNYLEQAFAALENVDAVIGPAADGGYVLLGLKRFSPELFTNFMWGSSNVFTQTCQVLDNLAWSYKKLDIMQDIDRPEDLLRHPDLVKKIS